MTRGDWILAIATAIFMVAAIAMAWSGLPFLGIR